MRSFFRVYSLYFFALLLPFPPFSHLFRLLHSSPFLLFSFLFSSSFYACHFTTVLSPADVHGDDVYACGNLPRDCFCDSVLIIALLANGHGKFIWDVMTTSFF